MTRSALAAAAMLVASCYALPPAPPPSRPVRLLALSEPGFPVRADAPTRVRAVKQRLLDVGATYLMSVGSLGRDADETVAALDSAGLDYLGLAARDLARGPDALLPALGRARFRVLSANCALIDGLPIDVVMPWDTLRAIRRLDQLPPPPTGPGAPRPPTPAQLQEAYAKARAGAPKVGVFAVTEAGTFGWATCGDPTEAAKRAIDQLTDARVDVIIAITEQPLPDDVALLRRDGRVDLVVGRGEGTAVDSLVAGRHLLVPDVGIGSLQFATLWGGGPAFGPGGVAPTRVPWRQATRRIDLAEPDTARLP